MAKSSRKSGAPPPGGLKAPPPGGFKAPAPGGASSSQESGKPTKGGANK